jgi:hypothetical protein
MLTKFRGSWWRFGHKFVDRSKEAIFGLLCSSVFAIRGLSAPGRRTVRESGFVLFRTKFFRVVFLFLTSGQSGVQLSEVSGAFSVTFLELLIFTADSPRPGGRQSAVHFSNHVRTVSDQCGFLFWPADSPGLDRGQSVVHRWKCVQNLVCSVCFSRSDLRTVWCKTRTVRRCGQVPV